MYFGFCKMSRTQGMFHILDNLEGLRLLDLSYFSTSEVSLPNRVGQLSHLRYLDLSFTGFRRVLSSLCKLVHLQVLDMRGCKLQQSPEWMNRSINLRHLYANPDVISSIRWIRRLNIQELEEFHNKWTNRWIYLVENLLLTLFIMCRQKRRQLVPN